MNHNCTDQTAQAGLCVCCSQMPKIGFHTRCPLNVKIIKEDNSSVFTADEQLGPGELKRKYLIGFPSLSTFVHK